jgi:hypothetical protein
MSWFQPCELCPQIPKAVRAIGDMPAFRAVRPSSGGDAVRPPKDRVDGCVLATALGPRSKAAPGSWP